MIKQIAAQGIGMLVSSFARALTGVLPNWRGCLPEARQRVYFANHASHGDFVLIWTVLPRALRRATRPVAAIDYWGGGVRGFIGREVFNAVLVDRSGATREPISVIMEAMQQGASLIIFPEGMPKGEFLPVPLLCSVTFGAPLAVQPGQDKDAFLSEAREALLALRPGRSAA